MKFLAVALVGVGACGGASARLELANNTPEARSSLLADGTSLRLKIIAAYLAEDVDPQTMNNVGSTEMIWINPQCNDDISGCNVDGFAEPAGGPRITEYFDLARPSDEVNADINGQDQTISAGTYRYARIELCKAYDRAQPTVPTMMWAGPGMTAEQPFTSGDCGRTSLAFDPPLVLGIGDAVSITLGYDLAHSIVSGTPSPNLGANMPSQIVGSDHWFRTCEDIDADHRACMDFPDFAPTATKL